MSDENLVILEFKYLQNKKWQKQAVKSARIKKSYREHTDYSHFTQNFQPEMAGFGSKMSYKTENHS